MDRLSIGCAALSVCLWGFSVSAAPDDLGGVRLGVYDVKAAGGSGAYVDGLVQGLERDGYTVETFSYLDLLSLMQFDIVILSDMHKPGNAPSDWKQNIVSYVEAGGSVLQTWHHHILGEVSVGVKRIYGRRRILIKPGHPAVTGMEPFDAQFKDHIVEHVGHKGTVLLENELGEAVAAAGTMGKGKVISTGLALAMPGGRSTRPATGPEKQLLDAFLAWLKPNVPAAERIAAIGNDLRLSVSPEKILSAAGFTAEATVRVGPVRPGEPLEVRCDGALLRPLDSGSDEGIQTYAFRFDVPPGRSSVTVKRITARCGEQEAGREIEVTGIYAPPPDDEVRGVWLHVRTDRYPKDVMPELKELGITHAVLRIAGGTAAFYGSKVQPDVQDPMAEEGGDWLADAVRHAHANGIEMHPYVNNCVVEGRTSAESLARLRDAGRLQQSPAGDVINWFCPSHPENLTAIARPMVEIAANYDIDGLQYDFIRYPNSQGCFCPRCRALFEQESGEGVQDWPADVLEGGSRYDAWIEFRCRRISSIVEYVSAEVRKVNAEVTLSAAVFRDWPSCRVTNGQDWVRWCEEGWLDMVFPMTYTQDAEAYDQMVKTHLQALPKDFPVVEGIGIRSGSGTMNDPAKVALHIVLARRAGAVGWCGFCYTPDHTRMLFEPLKTWLDGGAATPRP